MTQFVKTISMHRKTLIVGLTVFAGWTLFAFFLPTILKYVSDDPYDRGLRALDQGEAARAASLFAESVQENFKGTSPDALFKLIEMPEMAALEQLICLWDGRDTATLADKSRTVVCRRIHEAFELVTPNLPCTPGASREARRKEKEVMLQELEKAKASCDWVDGRFVPRPTVSTQAGE
jgi:hypothetical protein